MNAQPSQNACVADIVDIMERLAPLHLAEQWDNCGLHVGSRNWPVRSIWVALDPLPLVAREAARAGADLLITHHPLIFRPLLAIDVDSVIGQVIETAMNARMAVYCAHTNLDSASEGVNQVLAHTLGLKQLTPMVSPAPAATGDAAPGVAGMGRLGVFDRPLPLAQLVVEVQRRLGISQVRAAGDPALMVHQAAVCSGSGSGLLAEFFKTQAEVYISGDLRYHDARAAEDAGRALIDVGHFASEHLVIGPLVTQLREAVTLMGLQVKIEACDLERDPFYSRG